MSESHEHAIWNRAALEDGGAAPGAGDSALAAVLRAHGYVMNGGVHHAVECLTSDERAAAIAGYSYFGLSAAGDVLESAARGTLSPCTDASENAANAAYALAIPDDSALTRAFTSALRERPSDFARIGV